ncbi:MAG: prepilin-type N-terminal cleavage/methylation domain-containing protein [Opitutales bacterium]|nr:prepilin-type N-terminal cleavage/methylation domain-containing protein [Opitutales bacterium]
MTTAPKPHAGFTLIEALIALAIAGLAFAVLTQSFANTLTALRLMEIEADRQGDIRFVRSIAIMEPDLDEFERGDTIETLDRGRATWRGMVEPTTVPDLFRVRLTIEFENPEGGLPIEHEETFFLLRPTWSDPVDRSSLLSEMKDSVEFERGFLDWQ